MKTLRARPSASGFTLLEMIIVVAIMAVMVGAAVPVTSKVLTYKARKATREELQLLSEAATEYFRDTWTLPAELGDLIVDDGRDGWSGPYLPGVVTDAVTGRSGYEVDAWSRAYALARSGDVLTITSAGEGAAFGDSDDLAIDLDVTWVRREHTLEELRVLNQAILIYNGQFQMLDPLDTDWSTAFSQLVSRSMLPNNSDLLTDGWGEEYQADPPGVSPVVLVRSPNLPSAGYSAGSGSGGGSGPGGNGNGNGAGGNGQGNNGNGLGNGGGDGSNGSSGGNGNKGK